MTSGRTQSGGDDRFAANPDGDVYVQVVEFTVGGERYGVDIDRVAAVVDGSEVVDPDERELATARPSDRPRSVGALEHDGETLPVVDPRGLAAGDPSAGEAVGADGGDTTFGQVLVVDPAGCAGATARGWLVDDVTGVAHLECDALDRSAATGEWVAGVVEREDGPVHLVDPDA